MAEMNPPTGPNGGFLYEPRSIWSVASVETNDDVLPDSAEFARVVFSRNELRNGQRWPVILNRIAIMAVNYLYTDPASTFTSPRDAGASFLSRVRLRIGVPFRQSWSRFEILTSTYRPAPTYAEPTVTGPYSGLFGQVRLNYDKPLYMPRNGAIEMALSSPSDVSSFGPPQNNVFGTAGVTSIPTNIAYLEEGGLLPGSARSKRLNLNLSQDPNQHPNAQGIPYMLPPNFGPATVNNGVKFWDARHTFNAREFNQREATRAGSTKQLGVGIAMDQRAYDDALIALFGSSGQIAPLSMRVGSRVKTSSFGSQADWWRPGAPLALTFDTISPAVVYHFPQPITLQPGDSLSVEALFPGPAYAASFGQVTAGVENAPNYALGISFNGYAAIEG